MDILTYKNYQVGLTPYKVQDLKYDKSISEILMIKENENPIHGTIILILSTYLSINMKSKAITSKEAINLIIDYIKNECGNLDLQEVEFVIKSGVMGKFGVIYNDISIDTICGKDGWFETYYKEYRKLRPESGTGYNELVETIERLNSTNTPKHIIDEYIKQLERVKDIKDNTSFKLSGTEMTKEELFKKDENYAEFRKIIQDAKEFKVSQEGAKSFLESNNINFEKELNKIEIEFEKSGLEQYGQDKEVYISYHLSTLILKIRSNQITLIDIYKRALKNKTNTDDAKKFYLIKELTLNDFKDDCEIYSGQYHSLPESEKQCFTETQFLNNCHCSFIIQNFNKVKE